MADARYHVILPPKLDGDFADLAKTLGTTRAEVLRRAITLLKFMDDKATEGSKILVQDASGKTQEVLIRLTK
jgi:hypothetical protein